MGAVNLFKVNFIIYLNINKMFKIDYENISKIFLKYIIIS